MRWQEDLARMLNAKIVDIEVCWGQWQIMLAEKSEPGCLCRAGQKTGAGWLQGHCVEVCVCVYASMCVYMHVCLCVHAVCVSCALVLTASSFIFREQEGKHSWRCTHRCRTVWLEPDSPRFSSLLSWPSLMSRSCGRYVPWAGGEPEKSIRRPVFLGKQLVSAQNSMMSRDVIITSVYVCI